MDKEKIDWKTSSTSESFTQWDEEQEDSIEVGYKENEGKVDYSEINLNILDLMAERFTANKHKYPKGNMLKPLDKGSLVWASFRHIKKMIKPATDDPETFKEHLAAVVCNMSMILDQIEREEVEPTKEIVC